MVEKSDILNSTNTTHLTLSPTHKPIIHTYDSGDIGFMILASVMLWIMIPGYGLFYSGMARSKSALSMISLSFWTIAIVSIQWFVFGYSLSFSTSSRNPLIGNFDKVFLIGVYDNEFPTAEGIPELAFCLYQGITAILPCSLVVGALAERARILPALTFIFLWNTFVYAPCCYWSLNPNGWSFRIGVLDFGGGAPVHVPAGGAALAYSYLLGPRDIEDRIAKPHNMANLQIGTILIWFGSFGYNAGSAFSSDMQSLMSCLITNLSGAYGALTWNVIDYLSEKKCTAFGLCAGSVVGLIAITPASGFINPASAAAFGILGSLICRWAHELRRKMRFDDALDVFAVHGLAGIVGVLLTGIFTQKFYGGEEAGEGGWMDGHWIQIVYQTADTFAGFFWSFTASLIILKIMDKTPYLRLRINLEDEKTGVDTVELGVACYEHIEDLKLDSIQSVHVPLNHIEVSHYHHNPASQNDVLHPIHHKNGIDNSPFNIPIISHHHDNWKSYWHSASD